MTEYEPTPPPLPTQVRQDDQLPKEFHRYGGFAAIAFLAAGIGCFALAAVGFVLSIHSDVGLLQHYTSTTLPTLLGLGLVAKGLLSFRGLRRVIVDQTTITLEYRSSHQQIRWDDVAWNAETLTLAQTKTTTLYGHDGRILARIPAILSNWDELATLINRRVKANPTATAELVRKSKLRRQGFYMFGGAFVAYALLTPLTVMEYQDHRDQQLLAQTGIEGVATIERKFLAPDGRTCRVEFRVNAKHPNGSLPDVNNVEVEPLTWQLLSEGAQIPVRYAPSNPNIGVLVKGQRPDGFNLSFTGKILVISCGFLLGTFFLVCGILNLKGIDMVIDQETKKFRISRSVSA